MLDHPLDNEHLQKLPPDRSNYIFLVLRSWYQKPSCSGVAEPLLLNLTASKFEAGVSKTQGCSSHPHVPRCGLAFASCFWPAWAILSWAGAAFG